MQNLIMAAVIIIFAILVIIMIKNDRKNNDLKEYDRSKKEEGMVLLVGQLQKVDKN